MEICYFPIAPIKIIKERKRKKNRIYLFYSDHSEKERDHFFSKNEYFQIPLKNSLLRAERTP